MTPLIPALGGALFVAGIIGLVVGPPPTLPGTPVKHQQGRLGRRIAQMPRRTRIRALIALLVGVAVAVLTGFLLAVVALPAAAVGLPFLLSPARGGSSPERLQALEEWTRGLSGRLTIGMGLDSALKRSLSTTPEAIRPEVTRLVNRLWSDWTVDRALRVFADEIDDEVGDFIALNLVLAATNSGGAGLADTLDGIAESVAATVRARRSIAADQQKPRTTATVVTAISIAVLGYMFLNGSYIQPYTTALGQAILLVLGSAYVAILLWMRSMSKPPQGMRLMVSPEGQGR
jgi:tight adherence protein B